MRAHARLEPHIDVSEKADHYLARIAAPEDHALDDVRAVLDNGELLLQGALVKEREAEYEYMTRRRAGVFSEPHQQALVGVLPAGQHVMGNAPTNSGWIALDDDETWMLDDGSLALVGRPTPSRPIAFAKRVPLPADAELRHARSQPDGRGGLLVTVPRSLRRHAPAARRHVPVNTKRSPAPQPQPASTTKKPMGTTSIPSHPPAKPEGTSKPAPTKSSTKDVSAEEYKQTHKRKAAERRRDLAEELAELHGIEYQGPVLVECDASSRNVQSPTESVEEWVATSSGGFARGHGDDSAVGMAVQLEQESVEEEDELSYWGF